MRPVVCGLIRALAAETHEDWLEASRYLNMELAQRTQETAAQSRSLTEGAAPGRLDELCWGSSSAALHGLT